MHTVSSTDDQTTFFYCLIVFTKKKIYFNTPRDIPDLGTKKKKKQNWPMLQKMLESRFLGQPHTHTTTISKHCVHTIVCDVWSLVCL